MAGPEMGVEVNWRSKQGTLTADNRDCCGVGLRDDAILCIVLDGSTSGLKSGEFGRLVARGLVDWFIDAEEATAAAVNNQLRYLHANLSPRFWGASASFVIALIEREGRVWLLHAGDCLAGSMGTQNQIDWATQPHTLANVLENKSSKEIAASPVRNRLTRSFRSKEFMLPESAELKLRSDRLLVLATDGFWAELDPQCHAEFLAEGSFSESKYRDDCSALSIQFIEGPENTILNGDTDNLYAL